MQHFYLQLSENVYGLIIYIANVYERSVFLKMYWLFLFFKLLAPHIVNNWGSFICGELQQCATGLDILFDDLWLFFM